jgi:dinuclear metal center YbgI/SA1388 family protein
MMMADVTSYLQQIAPLDLAADWDNVGLLLGNADVGVQRILTCLTVTPAVVAEAVDQGVQLIVTHHPILFRPIQRLTTANTEGRMLLMLVSAGIAVYSAHTAYDNCPGGINDLLAQHLRLSDVEPLRPLTPPSPRRGEGRDEGQCKIVVFVPDTDLHKVSDAMFAAGAGRIGQYDECSFRLAGTGTFFGTESTNPTVGKKGRREDVSEWRLEVVCPEPRVDAVVRALRRAHSYEEPAFDVYPLRPAPHPASPLTPTPLPVGERGGGEGRRGGEGSGEGRVGRLAKPASLGELARIVKGALAAKQVQMVGDPGKAIERVAIICGSGRDLLADVFSAHADVLLTGEMRFHDYLAAEARELGLLLPGHYATERFAMEELAAKLQKRFPSLEVWSSRLERDPVCMLT